MLRFSLSSTILIGSSTSLRSFARPSSMCASVFDVLSLGSSVSLRSIGVCGSSISMINKSNSTKGPYLSCSFFDFCALASSFSIRGRKITKDISVANFVSIGSSVSLRRLLNVENIYR
jgi:hypothetical protein